MDFNICTCTAPVNIAVIKYWGKRNEELILPINDSISITLNSDQMHAKTTVARSKSFKHDRIWLNGKEENITNPRLVNCLREIRKRTQSEDKVHICSENNFPTAAGLASSAAGYACLVYTLCQVFDIKENISVIARQGSGSACRSIYGGFVQWHMGNQEDGSDSTASVIRDADFWNDLHVLILVVSDERKKVPSSVGMKRSVETSKLLQHRAKEVVPDRIRQMRQAIENKNFEAFGELTMQDSNQLHAVCLDTYPPCVYMNTISHNIVQLVHEFNRVSKSTKACYTFDAGPNACLVLPKSNVPEFLGYVKHYFPSDSSEYIKGKSIELKEVSKSMIDEMVVEVHPKDTLRYIISTDIGHGPKIVAGNTIELPEHLLNADGLPQNH